MNYKQLTALADYLYEHQTNDKKMFSFKVASDDMKIQEGHKAFMRKLDRFAHYEPSAATEPLSIVHITREVIFGDDLSMDLQYTYGAQSKIENMGYEAWIIEDADMQQELLSYIKFAKEKKGISN